MGLYSDILEDTREHLDQRQTAEWRPPARTELPPQIPPVDCPLCGHSFPHDMAMQKHLRSVHGQSHVYIKADDRVVRRSELFPETPRRCQLILLGVNEVHVTVSLINATSPPQFTAYETTDLLRPDLVPKDYKGELRVDVSYARIQKHFVMYFGTRPPFDHKALDTAVVDLQRQLDTTGKPDYTAYRRRLKELSRNEHEKAYLDGFQEYVHAFDLEKRSHWRRSALHLERAFTLLSSFPTPLARAACRILAIRMNSFRSPSLAQCPPRSIFFCARAFFVDNCFQLPPHADPPARASSDFGVYVDEFTDRLLDALQAFYARDFPDLFARIKDLSDHPLAEEQNNLHKLLILRARGYRVYGDTRAARENYERLAHHPIFKTEAQQFLNTNRDKV